MNDGRHVFFGTDLAEGHPGEQLHAGGRRVEQILRFIGEALVIGVGSDAQHLCLDFRVAVAKQRLERQDG